MQQNYFMSILYCILGRELAKLKLFYGFSNFSLKKNCSGLGVYKYEYMTMKYILCAGQLRAGAIIHVRERKNFLLHISSNQYK